MKNIYIITGGTMVHVTPHFSFCAPAYGKVGDDLSDAIITEIMDVDLNQEYNMHVLPTRMALSSVQDFECYRNFDRIYKKVRIKHLETNDDLSTLVDYLIEQEDTRCIVMAAAVCDFKPVALIDTEINGEFLDEFGKNQKRLESSTDYTINLTADEKILSKIRKTRKDIFLVSFKTTSGVDEDETYRKGLESLKKNSSNLVFANDIKNKVNMVVTPEEFPYKCDSRKGAISTLANMMMSRLQLTFNRTNVVEGDKANLNDLNEGNNIPSNFTKVLKHLIDKKAFKPFLGKTSGHFGCKVDGKSFDRVSSVRKVDHNNVMEDGVAKIFRKPNGGITAEGGRPSVGEHTQEMIYSELGDKVNSIIHFHSPLREGVDNISIRSQKDFECGSNECSINCVSGMKYMGNGIWAVHLENHGPNIAFNKNTDSSVVIDFINEHWNVSDKEGGLLESQSEYSNT